MKEVRIREEAMSFLIVIFRQTINSTHRLKKHIWRLGVKNVANYFYTTQHPVVLLCGFTFYSVSNDAN